jgi:cytochrome c oxidase subunit IV
MKNPTSSYRNFFLMLLASFFIMYGVMFLNVDQFDHVYTSLTRTYMTILMVAPMALLKLAFMWKMYKNKKLNYGIIVGSLILFIVTLFLLRTQEPIGDEQWMKAMIPHHSSAILTSSEADFSDPEVKKLAEDIIKAQVREIDQMKEMLERLEE